MGKKRSKSQRIGTAGEDYFRLFSGRHRLLPNKVEQDFGTDFLCQLEGALDGAGMAPVIGGVVGAFVRTTTNSRGRIHLTRSDVEHLLSCDYPVFIFLVHLGIIKHTSSLKNQIYQSLKNNGDIEVE
jgi:hypothetical protein